MTYAYVAPLADMRFAIERVLEAPDSWRASPAFVDLDMGTASAVLAEAARFAAEVLQPINAAGDLEGCTLDGDGGVRTPAGYRAAYRAYVEGGWPALPCDPAWGGQGLPLLLDAAVREMLSACNHGWTMYPDLLHGAYETIAAHADDELKARYLARIARGEWLAAMALTEPQAGSDLGRLRTRAEPQPDGSVRVSGSKVFISGADHDLTDNIVHLVLARLPDAPPGTRGLSLALVPKILPDGTRNAWRCDGLERKMGIKGSATCTVGYDGATGWLVGAPHRGLQAMFLMMNSARLHVGLQGLGHQEMATQNALRYALEREQFGSPIAAQPAVRHALLRLQALTEAQRLVAYRTALAIDEAHHHSEASRRDAAAARAALLTPVVKAFCTHHGFHGAAAAQQVWGGYGYVHEYGIEQTVRDARIAMVYEGTNEIQAIDLVQRKVLADGGRALAALLDDCEAEAARVQRTGDGEVFAAALRGQIDAARRATAALGAAGDREAPLAAADDFLFGISHLLLAWAFAAGARAAHEAIGDAAAPTAIDGDTAWSDGWLRARRERARYGVQWLLPQAGVHWHRVGLAAGAALPKVHAR